VKVDDNECNGDLGAEMKNAVYSNSLYIERQLDTFNDEQYYTLDTEDK